MRKFLLTLGFAVLASNFFAISAKAAGVPFNLDTINELRRAPTGLVVVATRGESMVLLKPEIASDCLRMYMYARALEVNSNANGTPRLFDFRISNEVDGSKCALVTP